MRAFLGVGIILLLTGCGLMAPVFSLHWWFLVIGAITVGGSVPARGEKQK